MKLLKVKVCLEVNQYKVRVALLNEFLGIQNYAERKEFMKKV